MENKSCTIKNKKGEIKTILDQTRLENKYFEYITTLPHVSKNEKQLSDYVVSIAKKLGYEYVQDDL